jgi:tetratricopeptide (TPR) repeat protein
MSIRSLWNAMVLATACAASAPLHADEYADIERLYRAGDLQQALRRADAAIAEQPRAAQVRFLKGVMLADLQLDSQAIEVFTALTQDFPELPDPYNNLAVLYAADGQLHRALVALQTALRNDPNHRAAREKLWPGRPGPQPRLAPKAMTLPCAASCSSHAKSRRCPHGPQ